MGPAACNDRRAPETAESMEIGPEASCSVTAGKITTLAGFGGVLRKDSMQGVRTELSTPFKNHIVIDDFP